MSEEVLEAWLSAREKHLPCALVTVAATTGSVPRKPGAKMLVIDDRRTVGTIGGGRFEALVIGESLAAIRAGAPILKKYPLHEGDTESFGAICGGEVTVLIEPHGVGEALVLIGAGHCSRAIAALARSCHWHVTVVDDRPAMLDDFPAHQRVVDLAPAQFIGGHSWRDQEALVIVSRNYEIDREALRAALEKPGIGYLGMIGSRRKVRRVFDQLRAERVRPEQLAAVYAPIGLDVGADSPAEIAVSVFAEVLQVLRGRPGGHLRAPFSG